jgi:hypothetical protein
MLSRSLNAKAHIILRLWIGQATDNTLNKLLHQAN